MKPNTVFKRAYNRGLARLRDYAIASNIGSEPSWSQALAVSRTTVRAIFSAFAVRGLIAYDGRRKALLRKPVPADFYPEVETEQVGAVVEKQFMQWILHGDCKPGQQLNALELSRQFGVSASAMRDYLNRFPRYGLLERRPSGSWVFNGFTEDFAEELCEVRSMFELRSALRFISLADEEPAWAELSRIRNDHLALLEEAESRFTDFSALDERFHRCINDASRNRFIVGFYDVISLIFHYHYQWNKRHERERNIAAMHEHLTYIDALQRRDASAVTQSCNAHMATARLTLLASIQGARDAPDPGRPWPVPGHLASGEPSQARSRHRPGARDG
ncbi:MAG TPA: GntR family transcriptional regulator [Roseiarcus sp.]|nr:GntR family transcriptional regulator [Roseiarcus sp.]